MLKKLVPLLNIHKKNKINFFRYDYHLFVCNKRMNCTNSSVKLHFDSYSMEDVNKILITINNSDLNELLRYEIAKTRANKIVSYRVRNGLLKDLEDILSIEGFNVKLANKLFGSILNGPKDTQNERGMKKVRKLQFTIPKLEETQRANIKSCISIDIGVNSISWSRLKLPEQQLNKHTNEPYALLLTHWEYHRITEESNKLHLEQLIQRCLKIISTIPTADCYVMENPLVHHTSNVPNATMQNISVQKAQMEAMVGLSLTSRNQFYKNDIENFEIPAIYVSNVFYMRRNITPRLFKYLIGMERVSSQNNVRSMLDDSLQVTANKDPELEPRGHIQFPKELKNFFSNASSSTREYLSRSLLLNLAFVRLILLQDQYSLNVMNNTNVQLSKTL